MNLDGAIRECLLALDVGMARKLWPYMHAHIPQPETDDEVLHMLHLARMQMRTLGAREKAYSRKWLAERERQARDAWAVGISVNARSLNSMKRALMTRCALEVAVNQAIKDGVDLATEGAEISRRLAIARSRA